MDQLSIFSVSLEGRHGDYGYLILFDVVSDTASNAQEMALLEAKKQDLTITDVDEIENHGPHPTATIPHVLKVYGKIYFDLED